MNPRRFLAVLPLIALALTACGANEPDSPAAERTAVIAPQVPATPGAAVSEAQDDCWTDPSGDPFAWRATFNEISIDPVRAVTFLESLPEPSEGCTDVDRDSLAQSDVTAAAMRERFPDLFTE